MLNPLRYRGPGGALTACRIAMTVSYRPLDSPRPRRLPPPWSVMNYGVPTGGGGRANTVSPQTAILECSQPPRRTRTRPPCYWARYLQWNHRADKSHLHKFYGLTNVIGGGGCFSYFHTAPMPPSSPSSKAVTSDLSNTHFSATFAILISKQGKTYLLRAYF